MKKKELKNLVDMALKDMPEDSMSDTERKNYRDSMFAKIDSGTITSPEMIMAEWDRLEHVPSCGNCATICKIQKRWKNKVCKDHSFYKGT